MPHFYRFYVPDLPDAPGEAALPPEEAHHATRVARLREGAEVALFDGVGGLAEGKLARAGKHEAVVAVDSVRREAPPSPAVTLLMAGLQRDKLHEEVVRHATELGARRLVFYRAERSEKPVRLQEKWQRICVEACKQCGRAWLPELRVTASLAEALGHAEGRLLTASLTQEPVPLAEAVQGDAVSIAIGPEGDFTEAENALLQAHGATPISLGAHALRSETAAFVGLTLVQYASGNLGPL